MKVAIIGNSHVAALKQGWESIKDRYSDKDLKITFFGARRSRIEGLKLEGNKLIATNKQLEESLAATSGGLTEIRPYDYQVIVLHGLGFRFVSGCESERISSGFLKVCDAHRFENSLLNTTLQKLVNAGYSSQIILGHTPLKAEKCLNVHDVTLEQRVENVNKSILNRALMLSQPASTLANQFSTRLELTKNSMRLDIGSHTNVNDSYHGDDDVEHMNSDFGREYMQTFLHVFFK